MKGKAHLNIGRASEEEEEEQNDQSVYSTNTEKCMYGISGLGERERGPKSTK